MERRFWPLLDLEARPAPDSLAFGFAGDRLLITRSDERADVPALAELGALAAGTEPIHIGRLDGRACFALAVENLSDPPPPFALMGLRELFGRLPPDLQTVAGRAYQILQWHGGHAYCGRCGAPTEPLEGEGARVCPRCRAQYFPRINPAVIMLVERGDTMLLASNRRFVGPFYSALAGFVEPGESLEEAVAREVWEEVGIEIDEVRYFGSQSWPFPSQLMIAFTARHRSGEIKLQHSEIRDARWFGVTDLPRLPGRFAIARWLIDSFLERHGALRR
jgi:NAD+ diphosphatase